MGTLAGVSANTYTGQMGYMVYPFDRDTILKATTLKAGVKNASKVQFIINNPDTGVKLIGKRQASSKIYVDSNDYESVIRAVGRYERRIYRTYRGRLLRLMQIFSQCQMKWKISGINIASASMSVDGYKSLTENGKGIIAVYNTDGTIEKVLISEDNINSTNGTAHFKRTSEF